MYSQISSGANIFSLFLRQRERSPRHAKNPKSFASLTENSINKYLENMLLAVQSLRIDNI